MSRAHFGQRASFSLGTILARPTHSRARQIAAAGGGKGHTTLEFPSEFRRARNNRFHLLLAFGPGPVHRRFFPRQVCLHLLKLLGDCSHPFVKLRTHKILKDSRFLIVLAAQRKPRCASRVCASSAILTSGKSDVMRGKTYSSFGLLLYFS